MVVELAAVDESCVRGDVECESFKWSEPPCAWRLEEALPVDIGGNDEYDRSSSM